MNNNNNLFTTTLLCSLLIVSAPSSADIINDNPTRITDVNCGNLIFAKEITRFHITDPTSKCSKYFYKTTKKPLKFIINDISKKGHLSKSNLFSHNHRVTLNIVLDDFLKNTVNTNQIYSAGRSALYHPEEDTPEIDIFYRDLWFIKPKK